jgi:ABC-type dipeptide/oligopeptide/nickel transport system permease subunit
MIAGFYGGRIDNIMMRFIDLLYGLPSLPIIILMQAFFKALSNDVDRVGPLGRALVDIDNSFGGLFFVFIVIGLLGWIGMARLTRAQMLSYKQKEFVEAARAIGARDRRIILTHLLPNIIGPLVVVECLSIPGYIFTEASLSYLNLGINPPTASWGQMISDAQAAGFTSRPFLVLAPSIALAFTVLAFNFLGDGLRDALDPRLRGE